MASIRMGLSGYLDETSLHGFKYLGRQSGTVARVYWSVVIGMSIGYAVYQIQQQVDHWIKSPVITTVEGIDTPVKEIQFPTITFCHDDYFQPDNWALTEHVFNFFSFHCDGTIEGNCTGSQKLREDFQPFFELMYESVSDLVDNANFDNKSWALTDQSKVDAVVLAILNNMTTLEELKTVLINSIGKFGIVTKFYKLIPKIENEPLDCKDSYCQQIKLQVNKFFVKVETLGLPMLNFRGKTLFGTLLRLFSDKIGLTFDDERTEVTRTVQKKYCQDINSIENSIHKVMLMLGEAFDFEVSLHDLPSFYKVSTTQFKYSELRKHYPMYSYCNKIDEFLDESTFPRCERQWWDIGRDFIPRMTGNPYEDDPGHYCAGRARNFTGGNLTSIIHIMKFAYHAISEDDLKTLYDIMQRSNLSYHLLPFDQIVDNDYLETHLRPYVSVEDDEGEFDLTVTTKGLCYVWNGQNMSSLFAKMNEFSSFERANSTATKIENGALRRAKFRLDRHEQYLPDRQTIDGHFHIGVNSEKTYYDMTSRSTQIQKGLKTTITVPLMSVVSMGDLLDLQPQTRKCLFSYELEFAKNMTMFNNYSMTACKFECMVNISYQKCHCMPWNMIGNGNANICDSAGNDCFYVAMNNNSIWTQNCSDCLVDCNSIKFSFHEKQMDINEKTNCKSMHPGYRDTWKKLGGSSFSLVPNAVAATEILATDEIIEWKSAIRANQDFIIQRCYDFYKKDISIVEVELDGQTFMKLKQSQRSTWSDMMGSIGGILGLFCGFSVLVIAELVHWIFFVLNQVWSSKN